MSTIEFDFDFCDDDDVRVSASLCGMEEFDFFPITDEIPVDYAESIEYVEAREAVLSELRDVVSDMMRVINHAEKGLDIERSLLEDAD